jgi:hypothetical protein
MRASAAACRVAAALAKPAPAALGALVAASDGAVDDVGGSRGVRGPSSIQHIGARDIPKDAPPCPARSATLTYRK